MPDTSYIKEDHNGPKSRGTIPGLGYSKNEDFELSELFCRILPNSSAAGFCLQLQLYKQELFPYVFYNYNCNLSDEAEVKHVVNCV